MKPIKPPITENLISSDEFLAIGRKFYMQILLTIKKKDQNSKVINLDSSQDLPVKISLSHVQRDGLFRIDFNQKLIIPNFAKSIRKRSLNKGILP